MKYVKGLLKAQISSLKGKKWYHQRFDGSPYLLHMIAENELKNEKRKQRVGGNHTTRVCFFRNDRADWYILMDDIEKTTKTMLKLAQKEPSLSKNLLKQWSKDEKTYYFECEKISNLNIKQLSNKDLIKLHDKFYKLGAKRFTSSSIIDGFALGSDEVIAKKIMNLLKSKGLEKSYSQIFSKLTAPVKQSFINESEVSLLKIAKLVKNKQDIKKAMKKHIEKYFWSKNNYVMAYYLDEKEWLEEIEEIFQHKTNIGKQITKIATTPETNKLVKLELMKKLKVPKYLKTLLTISEDFTWWQDERKKATYWNAHISTKLLTEIAKRTGFTLHELKYMSVDEVSDIFSNPITKAEAKERIKGCAFFWNNNEHEAVTEKEIVKLKETMFEKKKENKTNSFTGLSASVGKVTGRVKVCKSSTEVNKVKKGDILVTIMTRPDYISGMKRAAALVTNEGGITCHAAIVARELGIPCVIGTRIATEVLKDNDLVEVDANRGIINILERAK